MQMTIIYAIMVEITNDKKILSFVRHDDLLALVIQDDFQGLYVFYQLNARVEIKNIIQRKLVALDLSTCLKSPKTRI